MSDLKYWPVPESLSINLPQPGQSGSFWEDRIDRRHAGIDIYAPAGSEVVATEGGIVLEIIEFTSPNILPYWNLSRCIVIENPQGTIFRYAELGNVIVEKAVSVVAGQLLGHVGRVLNLEKIDHASPQYIQKLKLVNSSSMLHFEMYSSLPVLHSGNYLGGNFFTDQKPGNLIDPSKYLGSIVGT